MTNWFASFRNRDVVLWQEGKLDDAAFEQAQVARARGLTVLAWGLLLLVVVGLVVAGQLSEHGAINVEQLLLVSGVMVLFGLAVGLRIGGFAKVGARNMVLAHNRARAEANPAQGLPKAARGAAAPPARYFGTYKRSVRYACTVLGVSGVGFVIVGSDHLNPRDRDLEKRGGSPPDAGAGFLAGVAVAA